MATDIAVCNFNNEPITVLQIMNVSKMEIGIQWYMLYLEFDVKLSRAVNILYNLEA